MAFELNCKTNFEMYVSHMRKLFEEYEQLQLEYAKLRQQFNEQKILSKNGYHHPNDNSKSVDDVRIELESEKYLTKSLKTEIRYLLEEIRKWQTRYMDLMTTIKLDQGNKVFENKEDKNELSLNMSQIEMENKELRETVEFLKSENCIFSDSIKDLEETSLKERLEWLKEKEKYDEVVVWSKGVYDNSKAIKIKLVEMEKNIQANNKDIQLFDNFLNFIDNCFKTLPNYENLRQDLDTSNICDKENKVKQYEKVLQNCLNGNSDSFDIKNNNRITSSSASIDESKIEILNLCKEVDRLKEENKGLTNENKEMKKLFKNDSKLSIDEVNLILEISKLTEQLKIEKESFYQLSQKFTRNRKVWEDNEKKSTEEIEKLDNFIATLIDTLNNLPSQLKTVSELESVLNMINETDNNRLI